MDQRNTTRAASLPGCSGSFGSLKPKVCTGDPPGPSLWPLRKPPPISGFFLCIRAPVEFSILNTAQPGYVLASEPAQVQTLPLGLKNPFLGRGEGVQEYLGVAFFVLGVSLTPSHRTGYKSFFPLTTGCARAADQVPCFLTRWWCSLSHRLPGEGRRSQVFGRPCLIVGACCLDVTTFFCQLMGFPSNH